MHRTRIFHHVRAAFIGVPVCLTILGASATLQAQQPQIPTLQVCNQTLVNGTATVNITARKDATHTGSFTVHVNLTCDPNTGYPTGNLTISGLSMNDSLIQGTIVATATNFEQLTSTGRVTPTAYLNGRCSVDSSVAIPGCRYWIMFADNHQATGAVGTPDVISFLVFNKAGQRVAYGTGPVAQGSITVAPTPF